MKENLYKDQYDKIDVPEDELLRSIQSGIDQADGKQSFKHQRKIKRSIVSTAAAVVLSATFLSSNVSNALADVPVIGEAYHVFNDMVGRNLTSQQLITELDEKSSGKGLDVMVTSAYYDGAVIGVSFKVEGNVKEDELHKVNGFYEIYGGNEAISDSKEIVALEKSGDGYIGQIQLAYPGKELPANTSFPLEFKRIGEKEGSWKFDVPVEQLPYEEVKLDEVRSNEQADVAVQFNSIIEGQASTAINYTGTFPLEGKHDQVRLDVVDENGEPVNVSVDGIDLETSQENDQIVVKGRSIIPENLKERTDYIEIHPKVAVSGVEDQFIRLSDKLPVKIQSSRQDHVISVNNIKVDGENVTLDFQINNGRADRYFGFYKDMARTEVVLVKESRKEIYEEPLKHTVKVLDKDKLSFRSTFDVSNLKDFNEDNYVVRVSLGTLSSNLPVELEPVKIELN
ncbi:DUF4179 domain-containing protein [Bacillus sp. N1-1]|jgi:hypothetical protein|uniref:DUF4179 domain-containing protein n=1 Tax=Bacillus sp. N1-1 TaxID=2682541 RepID=UPI0013190446|nr:DUF4179 domain-containing protein [Bacillus sp. N1-1]QHA91235.1 DUF4179 domain-containing protein [Bacillus sp. N1-1]